MAIRVTCPECDKQLQLANNLAGRRIKCPQCAALVSVPSADEDDLPVLEALDEAPAPAKATKKPAAVTAKKPAAPAAVTAKRAAPAKKTVAASPKLRRRDDDDDEDEDEAPRKMGGSNALLIAGAIIGAAVLLVGGGLAAFLLKSPHKAETVVVAPQGLQPVKGPPQTSEDPKPKPPIDDSGSEDVKKPLSGDEIYQRLLKSTVWIVTSEEVHRGPLVGFRIGSGSGVLVHLDQRLVVTNYHVVREQQEATVIFPVYKDKEPITEPKYYGENVKTLGIKGRVVDRDPGHDLALIQLESVPAGARVVQFASKSPKPAENVHSIGGSGVELRTGAGSLWNYTPGKVRQILEDHWEYAYDSYVQRVNSYIVLTDSPTNPGDSGGPVCNDRVQLVAVVSGGKRDAQAVSMNIDIREIRAFLMKFFQRSGLKWEERPSTTPIDKVTDLQALIGKLGSANPTERHKAVVAIGDMGADAQLAIPNLLALAKDTDPFVRQAVPRALEQIGPPANSEFAPVLQALKSDSPEVRRYAARTVGGSGIGGVPVAEAVPLLAAVLKDGDSVVRKNAASALGTIGPPARGVVGSVIALLKDTDLEVRRSAALAVDRIGVQGKESVPQMVEFLKDSSPDIRRLGATLLVKLGPEGKEAAPALAGVLKDPDPFVRRIALEALAKYGPDAKPAVAALRDVLHGKDKGLQLAALNVVVQLGEAGADVVPEVIEILAEPVLKETAVTALVKIGKPAIPALVEALRDNNPKIRAGACRALGDIGPDAKTASTIQLNGLQRDKDVDVRDAATDALRKINRKR
jgi:HEAT repeat protein/S1-C subfamily serine protease